jgi:D-lactate dehydrogenase
MERFLSKGAEAMIKVALYDTKEYDRPSFEYYGKLHDVQFRFLETKLNEDTVELAKGSDAVCVFVNDTVNAEVIDRLHEYGVKLIALRCAGYNNVDLQAAFGKIHVVHVPAYSPYAVAEHAIALLLTSVRRIHKAYNRTREFNFSLNGLTGFDFHGKTVGVIGTGKIGRIFIDICRGFGMNVIAYDAFPAKDSGIGYVSMDELFEKSDIISLHCPLTEETRHMIGADAIGRMKKGVVIVNTSRGGLIDAEALLEGIKDRKIGAACLDVYEEETDIFFEDRSGHILNDDLLSRLISMPNVIVTSHQAFLTEEALNNIAETTVNNIVSYFENDGICDNELCYRCGNIEQCRKERKEKCF